MEEIKKEHEDLEVKMTDLRKDVTETIIKLSKEEKGSKA
jgi:hypothetical protein